MKKQNKVLRVYKKIVSQPQLITPSSFLVITNYFTDRNNFKLDVVEQFSPDAEDSEDDSEVIDGVGVIDICGTLSNKDYESWCEEVTSYEGINEQLDVMIPKGLTKLILNIDSPGGEAFNCFESATEFRKKCDEANVKVFAYCNYSCSAAYAWASVADVIVAHPDAEVGSIGVLVSLINDSEALKKEGYDRVFVYAGEQKVPFKSDGTFKDEFIADLEYKIKKTYEKFVTHVANYRTLSKDKVIETQAKTFIAEDAKNLGLVDYIMTEKEFLEKVRVFTDER